MSQCRSLAWRAAALCQSVFCVWRHCYLWHQAVLVSRHSALCCGVFFGAGALWLVLRHCIMLHVLPGVASLSVSLQWWLLCCFDTSTKIITTINLCGIGQACCLLCPWWWPHFTVIFCCSGCCIGIQKTINFCGLGGIFCFAVFLCSGHCSIGIHMSP